MTETPERDAAGTPPESAHLSPARWIHRLPRRVVIFLIELYRTWVSPMRLPTCRFEPTCSGYAVEALTRHGFLYGGWLSVVRLLKCGPWHKPGYDPVPERGFRDLFTTAEQTVTSERSVEESTPSEVRGN
ncbi:membrane protein insertion efficiency factor YidD [Gordonia sp. HNM0687]|uniref:Putative membrane protein insertion efficiency factor n=1 Tax=Gordonia mangrovi TaxID=2665643 RepID=A0A6L7GS64_9ACTN|nr:membrane protein insertion efficiency factor YidD [Gordonia mangrovi]